MAAAAPARSSRRPPAPVDRNADQWVPPSPAGLRWTFGTSTLDEFVLNHAYLDVLRELVQNEYDAKGRSLTVDFQADRLVVSGSGDPIDTNGWRRLSVMLGTGPVAGSPTEIVRPKENSLGSKNFGLKALFLIGDVIYVRSGARQTVVDRLRGALPRPIPDNFSRTRRAIEIIVPYRTAADNNFPAFDVSAEAGAFASFEERLGSVLLRLANPGKVHSLTSIVIRSSRLDRIAEWTQFASPGESPMRGVDVVDRRARLHIRPARSARTGAVREIEYQRQFLSPAAIRPANVPSYFTRRGGYVTIGLGIRMKGRAVAVDHPGTAFYPLEAEATRTGCAVNISAPFLMNSDRSQVLDPSTSPWNAWLFEAAATFAVALLPSMYERWGAVAYSLLQSDPSSSVSVFSAAVQSELKVQKVWPVRRRARKGLSLFCLAKDVTWPTPASLGLVLDDGKALDPTVQARPDVLAMAVPAGGRPFTANSLVRLRCAGQEAKIRTKVGSAELNHYYTAYPAPLLNPDLQARFGHALDAVRRLTADQSADLKVTTSTLSAAGALAPAEELYAVDAETADMIGLPAEERLHPALLSSRTFRRLARPWRVQSWILDATTRAAKGDLGEDAKSGLYRFLLSHPTLTAADWGRVRRAPVLRDAAGAWVPPRLVLTADAGIPQALAAEFHLANAEYAGDAWLVRRLGLRRKLTGRDLVYCAKRIATPTSARAFQTLLEKHRRLLNRNVIRELKDVDFLPSSSGGLDAPVNLYMPTALNQMTLGDSVDYVIDSDARLCTVLGCRTVPTSEAIVRRLAKQREDGTRIQEWEKVYGSLIEALERERKSVKAFRADQVVNLDDAWCTPQEILVGRSHARRFLDFVPVASGRRGHLLLQLGASNTPAESHWRALFEGLSNRHPVGGAIPVAARRALYEAYRVLAGPPTGLAAGTRFLLDRRGKLHSRLDAEKLRLVINDDPGAAAAIEADGLPIAFADETVAASRRFLEAAGVKRLSESYRLVSTTIGQERTGPRWLGDLVGLLHRPYLAQVVVRLVVAEGERPSSESDLGRKLAALKRLSLVDSISGRFSIGRRSFLVPLTSEVEGDRVCLTGVRTKEDVIALLADIVARVAKPSTSMRRRLADAVFRVLSVSNERQVAAYLASRGIDWHPDTVTDDLDVGADDDDEDLLQDLLGQLFDKKAVDDKKNASAASPNTSDGGGGSGQTGPDSGGGGAPSPKSREPLPDLDGVTLEVVSTNSWSPPERGGSGGGYDGRGSGWTPRDPEQEARDRELGRRGEALVFREEVKRVVARGFPAESVVWVASTQEAADHDILSVDEHGNSLFIEVKTTTGRHGRFVWPRAEFNLAVAERGRYVLWRVYEGETNIPKARAFIDPIGLLLDSGMRIDLDTLSAEVEPLEPDQT